MDFKVIINLTQGLEIENLTQFVNLWNTHSEDGSYDLVLKVNKNKKKRTYNINSQCYVLSMKYHWVPGALRMCFWC